MANDTQAEPRLLFPGLQAFYDKAIPLAWVVVRIAIGWNLVVHGWGKVTQGMGPYTKAFTALGLEPVVLWWGSAMIIEFVGGLAIILGLLTRFFAAAAAIELFIITLIYWKTGFAWTRRGYEYTLMWGLCCFAIALRGGGPYSVDRKIGVQL